MNWPHLWSNILGWVSLHPVAAYLAIFLTALSESLALVGLPVPGTVMMIGIGNVLCESEVAGRWSGTIAGEA